MKTIIEVEFQDDYEPYMLALTLADAGAEHEKAALNWSEKRMNAAFEFHADYKKEEDPVYLALMRQAKFLYKLSGKVGKLMKPVEASSGGS